VTFFLVDKSQTGLQNNHMAQEEKSKENILEKFLPALIVISVVLAFIVGVLWQKVSVLEGGGVGTQVAGDVVNDAKPFAAGKLTDDEVGKVALVSQLDEKVDSENVGVAGDDHLRGSADAKVFILEYSDLECPYCASFHTTAQQAVEDYGGEVAWVYRHFPLDTIHQRAIPSAIASECVANLAGNDGFWSFVDSIFADQTNFLSDSGMKELALGIGIGADDYDSCIASGEFAGKVDDHYQSGLDAGVTGTPGNFVMNEKGEIWVIPGAVPYESLQATIDEALAS